MKVRGAESEVGSAPQRKSRLYKIPDLVGLRTSRGFSQADLAGRMVPPVSVGYISKLERGEALASATTLFDLARVFGSIWIEDELGYRYHLVYRGRMQDPPDLS